MYILLISLRNLSTHFPTVYLLVCNCKFAGSRSDEFCPFKNEEEIPAENENEKRSAFVRHAVKLENFKHEQHLKKTQHHALYSFDYNNDFSYKFFLFSRITLLYEYGKH